MHKVLLHCYWLLSKKLNSLHDSYEYIAYIAFYLEAERTYLVRKEKN